MAFGTEPIGSGRFAVSKSTRRSVKGRDRPHNFKARRQTAVFCLQIKILRPSASNGDAAGTETGGDDLYDKPKRQAAILAAQSAKEPDRFIHMLLERFG